MTHRYSNSLYALLTPVLPQRNSVPPLSVVSELEPPPSYEPDSPLKHKRAISSPPAALPPVAAAPTQHHLRSVTALVQHGKQPSTVFAPVHSDEALSTLPAATPLNPSLSSSALTAAASSPPSLSALSTSFHSLVLQLHNRWLQQHAVNTTNNTLHAFNFILHYASISRTVALHRQQHQLQQQLQQHTQLLSAMEDRVAEAEGAVGQLMYSMERVTEDAVAQRQKLSSLQHEVQQQRDRVAAAMEQYEAKLAEQSELLEQQQRSLERLLLVRLRLDFGVDAVIVALAFYLARLPLLRALLFTVAKQALPMRGRGVPVSGTLSTRGRRELVVGVGQLLVFSAVVARARSWAVEKGLHNTVGSYTRYAAMALQTVQAAAYRVAERDEQGAGVDLAGIGEASEADSERVRPAVAQPAAAARPSSGEATGSAGVVLGLAGDAVTGLVSSVGSTVVSAASLVGRLLTFGVADAEQQTEQRRAQP